MAKLTQMARLEALEARYMQTRRRKITGFRVVARDTGKPGFRVVLMDDAYRAHLAQRSGVSHG